MILWVELPTWFDSHGATKTSREVHCFLTEYLKTFHLAAIQHRFLVILEASMDFKMEKLYLFASFIKPKV
jgi:hypothetical protein